MGNVMFHSDFSVEFNELVPNFINHYRFLNLFMQIQIALSIFTSEKKSINYLKTQILFSFDF